MTSKYPGRCPRGGVPIARYYLAGYRRSSLLCEAYADPLRCDETLAFGQTGEPIRLGPFGPKVPVMLGARASHRSALAWRCRRTLENLSHRACFRKAGQPVGLSLLSAGEISGVARDRSAFEDVVVGCQRLDQEECGRDHDRRQ